MIELRGFVGVRHVIVGIVVFIALILTLTPVPVSAQPAVDTGGGGSGGGCDTYFITIPAWYNGLASPDQGGGCSIDSPSDVGGISPFVWKIVLNVVEIILNLVGYASVGFIIYGGYKYMISAGSPDGMVAARKTITNAVIGLIISVMAIGIVNFIANNLGSGGSASSTIESRHIV